MPCLTLRHVAPASDGNRVKRLGVRQGVRDVWESLGGDLATFLASAKLHTWQNQFANWGGEKTMSRRAMRGRSARKLSNSNQGYYLPDAPGAVLVKTRGTGCSSRNQFGNVRHAMDQTCSTLTARQRETMHADVRRKAATLLIDRDDSEKPQN